MKGFQCLSAEESIHTPIVTHKDSTVSLVEKIYIPGHFFRGFSE